MSRKVTNFYDRLSLLYHHNMGWDWDAAVREEGAQLSRFLADGLGGPGPYSLLDCSCGIGTQAIGLALQGHKVHATDLSTVSIQCAQEEAEKLDVDMSFGIANFCNLEDSVEGTFDIVLSCDNSISHNLTNKDLSSALSSMRSKLNPGGLLLLSVRDYDAIVADQPRFNNEHVQDREDGRRIVFQVWDWDDDGRRYAIHQFLIRQHDGEFEVNHFETKLRAVLRDELISAIRDAGYEKVRWHMPEDSGYYQPIVTARNN
jgi:SAM-dependent methyltransferase